MVLIAYRLVFTITNAYLSPIMFIVFVFLSYVMLGNQLNIVIIFTSLSVFKTFKGALTFLPNMMAGFYDILVSSGRLYDFLLSSELKRPINRYDETCELDINI